ncbi:MAG TPA: hypothetical protein VIR16_11210, partial [Candidatus Limnocylindrales bacterium]
MTAAGDRVTAGPGPTGSIYDIGYRGYDGPRLGRRHAFTTLFVGALRATYGFGRTARAKILPGFCLVFPAIIAVIFVAMNAFAARFGINDMGAIPGHPDMEGAVGVFVTILVAVQAPELLGRDVRYRVLSLYFSRALQRVDYALAKLAALSVAVAILLLVPHLILTVGAVLLTSDIGGALGREAGKWPAILGSVVLMSVAMPAVALLVAAYVARRAYATVTIFGLFIVPGIIATVIIALDLGPTSHWVVLLDIGTVLDAANAWFFGIVPSVGVWPESGLPVAVGVVASLVIAAGASAILV